MEDIISSLWAKQEVSQNLELPKDWFKPLCNLIHEMSDKEISEVHRDEIHVTMHEISDEEIDEEHDEEIDEERWDEIHVTMDKQIESSDDKKDESDLSGIEPLDDEADVLITEIEEYITSEEEMNEIAFANNDTEESRRDVEVDESIDFDWKKILHEMQNFKTYAELKEFVFEKQPLLPPPSVKMKYYLDNHDKICKVTNNFRPKGMPENFVPVLTIGDGNCLPHSLANVLLGDQGWSDEVRV